MIFQELEMDGASGEGVTDLERIIFKLFHDQPIEAQPKYIVDLSPNPSTLCQTIYRTVASRTRRGAYLSKHPLTVVVRAEQSAAFRSLKDEPITIRLADGGFAASDVLECMDAHSLFDAENALFLVELDPGTGRENEFAHVSVASATLITELARFSVLSKYGLVISTWPNAGRTSHQATGAECKGIAPGNGSSVVQYIELSDFLLELAGVGLFPEAGGFHLYRQSDSASAGVLCHMRERPYTVRPARGTDLSALALLEDACWAPGIRTSVEQLKGRLERFPRGQLVLEADGALAGVIYSQRVMQDEFDGVSAETVHKLSCDDGGVIQLLALNILPEMQHRSLGDQLLEFMLNLAAVITSVHTVIGVTRCKDYQKYRHVDIRSYISLRNAHGRLVDTVLRFHELHGAEIRRLMPNYRPLDSENDGFGVLVRYDLERRQRSELRLDEGRAADVTVYDKYSILHTVLQEVANIQQGLNTDEVDPGCPLFEIGLDSADLLDLNERINVRYGVVLEPAFFFEHNTCQKIADYLHARLIVRNDTIGATTKGAPQRVAEETSQLQVFPQTDIAVIGVSCELPGGISSPDQFWRLLYEERHAIMDLPSDRWVWPANIDPSGDYRGIDRGGFLHDVAQFDPLFFRITPREAELMDPQQRILLQLSWKCLEDANYAPSALSGTRTGVYVGASGSDYHLRLAETLAGDFDAHFALATSTSVLANRLSYFYNWCGPSLQIDTACSSSLVAIHEAVAAIRAGACDQALVCGVNVLCHPANSIAFYRAGMLSRDGKCKTFDNSANGYVRSEGAVVMLLKPLARAVNDDDRVYGVIKGSATNHGGQAAGLTVPSPSGQASLIRATLASASVAADTITYIEAHGTGTSLGDPVEVDGLKQAFKEPDACNTKTFCGLGSIKTNIGHLEAAAGIAGLLKVLLCLQHRYLPASLNFHELNRHISLKESPFFIVNTGRAWTSLTDGMLLRAGVSSFGSGGSNAHVIVEEFLGTRPLPSPNESERPHIILLSARNDDRLRDRIQSLLAAIRHEPLTNQDLGRLAYTLQVGREHMEVRLALVVNTIEELEEKLRGYITANDGNGSITKSPPKGETSALSDVTRDPDMMLAVEKWISAHRYKPLLALWVRGLAVDWRALYGSTRPGCIRLPTYQFACERYWLPMQVGEGCADPVAARSRRGSLERDSSTLAIAKADTFDPGGRLVVLCPTWNVTRAMEGETWLGVEDRFLIVGGKPGRWDDVRKYCPNADVLEITPEAECEEIASRLAMYPNVGHILFLAPEIPPGSCDSDSIINGQKYGVLRCFHLIKSLARLGYGEANLNLTFLTTQTQPVQPFEAINPTHGSLHGFVGSIAKEYPNWRIRLIDMPMGEDWPLAQVFSMPADPVGNAWAFRRGEWYRQQLLPVEAQLAPSQAYRTAGVYVVIGGAGGIGEIWSEYMIRHYQAQIVWVGRRTADSAIEAKLNRLSAIGRRPLYITADATNRQALEGAYATIVHKFGRINGLVHSAIVLEDASLEKMDIEQFRAALSAKVDVSVRMAQVFGAATKIDFMLFFSSMQSFSKSPKQSNYVSGCTFKDAFAYELGRHLSCSVKVMNWGYWGTTGAASSEAYQQQMARHGIGSLESSEGMVGLEVLLTGRLNQIGMFKTNSPAVEAPQWT